MMDEVAFVESLFQPELRSTPQASPSTTTASSSRALLISASVTASSSFSSATPPSLSPFVSSPSRLRIKSSSMHLHGFQSGMDGTPRGVSGPEDDVAMRDFLNETVFDESMAMPAQIDHMVDHFQGSSLLEPLDLPRPPHSGGATPSGLFDPAFKDVFLHMAGSPITSSPLGYGMPQYKQYNAVGLHTPRGLMQDPHHTPRHNSLYSDNLIPVQPMGMTVQVASPTSGMSTVQALHHALWKNHPQGEAGRLNSASAKHMMLAAATASAPRNATAPTPSSSSFSMANELPRSSQLGAGPWDSRQGPAPPMYLSPVLLTPTGSMQAAPDLQRNISSKKSKARKPLKSPATQATPASNALKVSLEEEVSPLKKPRVKKQKTAALPPPPPPPPPAPMSQSDLSQQSGESDDGQSKNCKGKKCVEPSCTRRAQSNSRCKAHGGGARCQYAGEGGCTRSSQGGGFCRSHGGGKRCEVDGCTRGQQRKGLCYVHGGIRKCQAGDCEKKDRGNGFCISHGGGKRCVFPGCSRSVRRGNVCQLHEDAT